MSVFSKKIALVTGATSGIGKSIAFRLLNEGAEVIFIGRKFNGLEEEISGLALPGYKYHFIKSNFLVENDLINLIQKIKEISDQIDILVHSAGIINIGRLEDSEINELDALFQVNVRAPFFITQKLLPSLKEAKGSIVFINSTAGLESWANISQYAASKHALTAIAKSLREEVSPYGVKVISIYPGGTDTPMQELIQQIEGNDYHPAKFMSAKYVADSVLQALKISDASITLDIIIKPSQ